MRGARLAKLLGSGIKGDIVCVSCARICSLMDRFVCDPSPVRRRPPLCVCVQLNLPCVALHPPSQAGSRLPEGRLGTAWEGGPSFNARNEKSYLEAKRRASPSGSGRGHLGNEGRHAQSRCAFIAFPSVLLIPCSDHEALRGTLAAERQQLGITGRVNGEVRITKRCAARHTY